MKAHDFLNAGIGHMTDRAATYDAPKGERSMSKTVEMFNALLGDKLREPLTEEDGWNFMQILKLVRSKQGEFKSDNYEDGAAYAGLAGESAFNSRACKKECLRCEIKKCVNTDFRNDFYELLGKGIIPVFKNG